MTTKGKTDIPAPLFAAAGAGDLAYQQLRRLPEVAARTLRAAGRTADSLRERVTARDLRVSRDRFRIDVDRLRDATQRNAAAFVAGAASVPDRAVAGYRDLVARGERVVSGNGVIKVRSQIVTEPVAHPTAASTPPPSAAAPSTPPAPATKTTARKPAKRTPAS